MELLVGVGVFVGILRLVGQVHLPALWTLGVTLVLTIVVSTLVLDLGSRGIRAVGSAQGAVVVLLGLMGVVAGAYLVGRRILDHG